jgi:antitoxin (DNA-binding transcriptional repressor) of toxin-antitoxin stability system
MVTVGVRELKSQLSAYLRRVRDGETVRVTHRGEVIAELRPPDAGEGPTPHSGLNALIREGKARAPLAAPPADLYHLEERPNIPLVEILDTLDWLRGDR